MFCTECGKENQDSAVFCSSCGAKIGTQNSSQESQGNNQAFTVQLNSVAPATIDPTTICMLRRTNTGISIKIAGVFFKKVFSYLTPQGIQDDWNRLIEALQRITNNGTMPFNAEESPVIPVYLMKRITVNTGWKRIEVDVQGAGMQWIQYPDVNSLNADYGKLMNMMNNRK